MLFGCIPNNAEFPVYIRQQPQKSPMETTPNILYVAGKYTLNLLNFGLQRAISLSDNVIADVILGIKS
jgi:hypothetical protein